MKAASVVPYWPELEPAYLVARRRNANVTT